VELKNKILALLGLALAVLGAWSIIAKKTILIERVIMLKFLQSYMVTGGSASIIGYRFIAISIALFLCVISDYVSYKYQIMIWISIMFSLIFVLYTYVVQIAA
jgi:hypothetical protein